MSGKELKKLAKAARLKPNEVCSKADLSLPTLYKVYNEDGAEQKSIDSVQRAILSLMAEIKAVVIPI